MFHRQSSPPVAGLLFLAAALFAMGWAATAETDPVIDPPASRSVQAEQPAGAAASRAADIKRRTSLDF
jgi:hypothetical protein